MSKKQIRNTFLIVLVCMIVSFAYSFFLKYREGRMPSHLRQVMGDSAGSACRSSLNLKATATGAQIVSYCNCYVDTVLNSMSDAEVTIAADRNTLDAADRARASLAQRHCQDRLYPRKVK